MNRQLDNKQKGFSLVEIAIVLVIIGLLLGGVLKGQEMIRQAKIKAQIQQINGIVSAINTYIDRYGYANFKALTDATDRWKALSDGGYISGYTSGDTLTNKYGRNIFIYLAGTFPHFTTITVCVILEKEYADEIDRKLDNGDPNSGSYLGFIPAFPYSTTNAICTSVGQ